jgi:hypothetical protein
VHWLLTSEIEIQSQGSPGDGQRALEKGFVRVLQFSLLVFIPLMLHTWSLIQGMNSGPVGGHSFTELSLIPSQK